MAVTGWMCEGQDITELYQELSFWVVGGPALVAARAAVVDSSQARGTSSAPRVQGELSAVRPKG